MKSTVKASHTLHLDGPALDEHEKVKAFVTRPGGHVILTAANPLGLANNILDPLVTPALSLLKRRVKGVLEGVGLHRRLQRLADRRVPGIRSAGVACFAPARK